MDTPIKNNALKNISEAQLNALGFIRRLSYCSRSEIGKYFGWGPPSVSKILKPMINRGILLSESMLDPRHQRRQACLKLNPDLVCAIGVDLGFSNFSLALVNLGGSIIERSPVFPMLNRKPETILEAIQSEIARFSEQFGDRIIIGTGIAFAGLVNNRNDVTRSFPDTQPWLHVPITDLLAKGYKGIIDIQNDTVAGLLGELRYGNALNCHNILSLGMVEGIGLGLLSNGRIHCGHNGNSGEFGHICVINDGTLLSLRRFWLLGECCFFLGHPQADEGSYSRWGQYQFRPAH